MRLPSLLTMLTLTMALSPMDIGGAPRAFDASQVERILNRISGDASRQGRQLDMSSLRNALAASADSNDSVGPGRISADSARSIMSQYVTTDMLAAALAGVAGGLRVPAPIRSSTQLIDAASETLTLTGTFGPGQVLVVISSFTGPPTVQVNQRSSMYGISGTLDGQNLQGGQTMPPIPLQTSAYGSLIPLDRAGTPLSIPALFAFATGDVGYAWFGVFADEETARGYLKLCGSN